MNITNVMEDQMMNKYVDTNEYITAMRGLIEQGKTVRIYISGSSMAPFLVHDRDSVFVKKLDKEIEKGDILFYQRKDGRYILHRVYKVSDDGIYFIGDGQSQTEGPLESNCVFGIVEKVERKGKYIVPGMFWWEFFRCVWIRIIPIRGLIKKMYGLTRNHDKGVV